MHVEETLLEGLLVVHLKTFSDERGFFVEKFNQKKLQANGIEGDFVQDNYSLSYPKVLRGLHVQTDPAQGKMVGCFSGAILDVAVDIRPNSKTFLEHFTIRLDEKNQTLLWIPKGFAHGFCVLGDQPACVHYKVTDYYNPSGEFGILWNDPTINIAWPYTDPILSSKDRENLTVDQLLKTESI